MKLVPTIGKFITYHIRIKLSANWLYTVKKTNQPAERKPGRTFKTGHYTTGGGTQLLQDVLWFVNGFLIIILLALKKYEVYKEYGNM